MRREVRGGGGVVHFNRQGNKGLRSCEDFCESSISDVVGAEVRLQAAEAWLRLWRMGIQGIQRNFSRNRKIALEL